MIAFVYFGVYDRKDRRMDANTKLTIAMVVLLVPMAAPLVYSLIAMHFGRQNQK